MGFRTFVFSLCHLNNSSLRGLYMLGRKRS
ncbi:hypothetical protein HMPREF9412_2922 [Paenibacillus sp. HGF5]|nr:hypothetical protein HMPREF9412_2922 [Paenibacillus sp. HGF5]